MVMPIEKGFQEYFDTKGEHCMKCYTSLKGNPVKMDILRPMLRENSQLTNWSNL
jgi:hypothetical protein